MSEKGRNFRSTYYDKVGFRGAEEKKALQNLINEKPMDKDKLSKFCLRFSLPPGFREFVWKVLLGILPTNFECHESIAKQRTLHYNDLLTSLKVMHMIDESTFTPTVHTLMYLMTFDTLQFNLKEQMSSSYVRNLISLASFFVELSSSEVMSYWLFRNFLLHQKKMNYNLKILVENIETSLKKEEESLYEHLKQINAFESLPFMSWFDTSFVEIIHQNSLERIYDKIIGGSNKILPFVVVAMLVVNKSLLMSMDNMHDIEELLKQNSEETSDIIVNKAMDMYYS